MVEPSAAQGLQGFDAAQGLRESVAAEGLYGVVAAQGFALQGEDTAAGWHGLWPAAAGLAEATPPTATAVPSAITVFLRKSRLMANIVLIS